MRRRVGRPGLLGTVARTAVIAGTAQAVAGNVAQKQGAQQQAAANEAAAQQQAAANEAAAQQAAQAEKAAMRGQLDQLQAAQPVAPVAPAPPAAPAGDLMAQLQQLAAMKEAGLLSDAEFSAAKAKLLG